MAQNPLLKILLSGAICLFLTACASTSISNFGSNSVVALDDDEERLWKRSEEAQEQLDKSGYVVEDKVLNDYVNSVFQKLVRGQSEDIVKHVQIRILREHQFNAFMLPNGSMYIHSSLLSNIENEAQLAMLLGHEYVHYLHRHSHKQIRSAINKTAFAGFAGIFAGASSGGSSLVSVFAQLSVLTTVFSYGRTLEEEADVEGFKLMRDAGYEPKEAIKFMENMLEATKDIKKKTPYLYSSHPRTKQRIKTLQELYDSLPESDKVGEKIIGEDRYFKETKRFLIEFAEEELGYKYGVKRVIRQMNRFLLADPLAYHAYYVLGKAKLRENNPQEARELFEKSMRINPDFADNYKDLGLILYEENNVEEASKLFKKYIELKPNAIDLEFIKGYIYG